MKILALLVMARDARLRLQAILESCSVRVLPVPDYERARRMLETRPNVRVVLTDATLPDGDWHAVLQLVAQSGTEAEVVVCTRLAQPRLWCEILQHGAYDLLVEPYQEEEVHRIVESAAATGYLRSQALAS